MCHYADDIIQNEFNSVRALQEKGGCSVKIQVPQVMSHGVIYRSNFQPGLLVSKDSRGTIEV